MTFYRISTNYHFPEKSDVSFFGTIGNFICDIVTYICQSGHFCEYVIIKDTYKNETSRLERFLSTLLLQVRNSDNYLVAINEFLTTADQGEMSLHCDEKNVFQIVGSIDSLVTWLQQYMNTNKMVSEALVSLFIYLLFHCRYIL